MKVMKHNHFAIVSAKQVGRVLDAYPHLAREAVEQAYLSHGRGETVNPPSAFLALERNRVIALQAATRHPPAVGCKLIASWPGNIQKNKPRASAVIVINDPETGEQVALLEGGQISSARTAASAVLAASHLDNADFPARSLAIIGGGVIAANVVETFAREGRHFHSVGCFDAIDENGRAFSSRVASRCGWRVEVLETLDAALEADMVVFATTAAKPYVMPPYAFRPGQLVLHLSLRDIGPELLLGAENVLDDIDHCLTAGTSPHLAEQLIGDRRFVTGTLAQVMTGVVTIDRRKPVIFSPFGLGVLDLTLAYAVWQCAEADGLALHLEDFIGGTDRWA